MKSLLLIRVYFYIKKLFISIRKLNGNFPQINEGNQSLNPKINPKQTLKMYRQMSMTSNPS